MSGQAVIAVTIFAIAMVVTIALGVLSARGREKSMDEWSVSGRGLGVVFIVLLMAGETYTSFSFLGTAGWSYSYGVPILYLVAYLNIGFAVAYRIGPLLWTYAARHGLVSVSDMAEHRYQSRPVGILVAVSATIFLLPYIQLQIQGMGAVVHAMTYDSVNLDIAAIISFVVAEAFILVSGLRGSAWVSVLKDGIVILSVIFLAIYVPLHYFGGIGGFVEKMVADKPDWLTFPGHGPGTYGAGWFISTIVLNGITIVVMPTTVAGYLGSKNPTILRRNSIILPWYQLLLFVPMIVGCAALFVVPALEDADLALFSVVIDALPAPVVALIGVAGALSAIVPMSVFMLAIGTMWGRTILRPRTGSARVDAGGSGSADQGVDGRPPVAGRRERQWSQLVCLVAGLAALVGSLAVPDALVSLSVLSYEGLAQLVPVLLLGLYWPRMSKQAATVGLLTGSAVMIALHFTGHDPLWGVNGGLYGLAVNLIFVVVVTMLRPDPRYRGSRTTSMITQE